MRENSLARSAMSLIQAPALKHSAPVAELVDARDSKSRFFGSARSIRAGGTNSLRVQTAEITADQKRQLSGIPLVQALLPIDRFTLRRWASTVRERNVEAVGNFLGAQALDRSCAAPHVSR